MSKVPAHLPKGIMDQVAKHLKWVDEPFDSKTLGKLKADVAYTTGKRGKRTSYAYTTDASGRIKTAHAYPLRLDGTKRASHSRNPADKVPGQDHAGHLLGDVFGGSQKLDNIVAQTSDVNLKEFGKAERRWRDMLEKNPNADLNVDIDVTYGSNGRPIKFEINETIDGIPQAPIEILN